MFKFNLMNLPVFQTLLTPVGQEALHTAAALQPREIDFLRHFERLSRHYPRELARAALEIATLRREAIVKFPAHAHKLYFTRKALQQATPAAIAACRAQRYRECRQIVDLGCSVGGDTLAFANYAPTFGLDRDPLRLAMAQANAAALGLSATFLQADLTRPLPLVPTKGAPPPALFFDPARRTNGKRAYSVRHYTPPLATVREWLPRFPALGVKIPPGVKLDELQPYDAELEFISLRGRLKEVVLWFGPLKTAARRATLLPGPHTLVESAEPKSQIEEPQAYLYEPDPAILRAGLITTLAAQLDAAQLDPDIAYLTAAHRVPTPFARVWVVEDWMPFHLKKLRATLQARGVGRVTIKKRGSPITPEALVRALRLKGSEEKMLFLTHLRGRPIAIIGAKIAD